MRSEPDPPVYIASPLGFTAWADEYRREVREHLKAKRLDPKDPWEIEPNLILAAKEQFPDPGPERMGALRIANARVGYLNEELIRNSRALLAILDGPDVDSGTAAEIGFASARQIPVIGLRQDTRVTGDDEGATVNLQVERFIYSSHGTITGSLDEAARLLRFVIDGSKPLPPNALGEIRPASPLPRPEDLLAGERT